MKHNGHFQTDLDGFSEECCDSFNVRVLVRVRGGGVWRVLKPDPLRPLKWTGSRKWFVDNNNGLHWSGALMGLETRLSASIFSWSWLG